MKTSLPPFSGSTFQRFNGLLVLLSAALFFFTVARAQMPLLDPASMRSSVSGQFVVIGADAIPSSARPPIAFTNAGFVRLEPALLAISAERVKQPIWRQLGVGPAMPWRGRIFLALHPAVSPDENVTIISARFNGVWNYRVELPDVLSRARLTRALTGAVLLELANRDNPADHAAEIPAWLTEGLAQQLLSDTPEMIVSPPDRAVNGMLENRSAIDRGVDALATAWTVLQDHRALTFEQLSWPDDAQLNDDDGGIYRASAQLFVNKLLGLNQGPEHLRAMLQLLPRYYNWQTAFRAAFAADFPRPVDLEKWWDLQAAGFAVRGAGPLWTPAASRDELDGILSVPVEMRSASNNLPVHAAISLQAVIRNFDFNQQTLVLKTKLRDLQLAQWRMAPQSVGLTDAYHRTLADYLGGRNGVAPSGTKVADTLKRLDALDAQRRNMESAAEPSVLANKLK
jgi:hypothetical protein